MRLHFVCRPWEPGCGASGTQRFFELYKQQGRDVHLSLSNSTRRATSFRVDQAQFPEILRDIQKSQPDWIVVASRSDFDLVRHLRRYGFTNVVVHDSDEVIHPSHDAILNELQRSAAMLLQEHKSIADARARAYPLGAYWLPPSFNRCLEPTTTDKIYDIGFLGYVNDYRRRILMEAFPRISSNWVIHNPAADGLLLGAEVGNFYARCRIVVGLPRLPNQHAATSDRLWQVLGSGSFYLMSGIRHANIPFRDGKHLVMFHGAHGLIDIARRFLYEEPDLRGIIAKAGQDAVYRSHLDVHRAGECWSFMERMLTTKGQRYENSGRI